jgi:NADH:ubiquinone oxidoreductase subunit F (NADH-binding)
VKVGHALSTFLFEESCGQCPPCKLGTEEIADRLGALAAGRGDAGDVGEIAAWTQRVTDANRCGLGAGQQVLAEGILEDFAADLAHHIGGEPCPGEREIRVPRMTGYDAAAGRFIYA